MGHEQSDYSDYYNGARESQTEKEWDEVEKLGEDTTQETMNAIYDDEKATDY